MRVWRPKAGNRYDDGRRAMYLEQRAAYARKLYRALHTLRLCTEQEVERKRKAIYEEAKRIEESRVDK